MLIIVDKKIPAKARENLSKYGNLLEFTTSGITYEAISGHPDIFFCKIGKELIIAPNTPEGYIKELKDNGVLFKIGSRDVGEKYPDSAIYNAMVTDHHFVHNCDISDTMLLSKAQRHKRIHINQGYCRCNLLLLKDNHFITSDKGISKALNRQFLQAVMWPLSILYYLVLIMAFWVGQWVFGKIRFLLLVTLIIWEKEIKSEKS